jgi:Protein of unknown function (DUF3300)
LENLRRRLIAAAVLPLLLSNTALVYAQNAPPPQYAPPPPPGAPPPPPQDAPAAMPQDGPATPQQLDQMLAPIALYPDQLLTQILMASTYPVQVVEAERWLENPANAAINGDALAATLEPLPWDPSVKALVPFPQVIKMLSDQLDWTQSLGNVFVNQQADVLNRVQFLRQQAQASGHLQTTPQMVVQQQGPAIVIEPANPQLVYVPVYDPGIVYGAWPWPTYRPYYFPGFFVGGGLGLGIGVGIGFTVGFGIIGPLWGWAHPNWGGHSIYVNHVVYNRFGGHGFAGDTWHHVGPVAGGGRFAQHAAFHPGFNGRAGGNLHPVINGPHGGPGQFHPGAGGNHPPGGGHPGGEHPGGVHPGNHAPHGGPVHEAHAQVPHGGAPHPAASHPHPAEHGGEEHHER